MLTKTLMYKLDITVNSNIVDKIVKSLNEIDGIDAEYKKLGYTDSKILIYFEKQVTDDEILALGVLIGTIKSSIT